MIASKIEIGVSISAHQPLIVPIKEEKELTTEIKDSMKERINPVDALNKFKRLHIVAKTPEETTNPAMIMGASSGTIKESNLSNIRFN